MRPWTVAAALLVSIACGKPAPLPAAAPLAEAHNFGFQAFLYPAGEDAWTVEVRCPSDLDGTYHGGLMGELIPVDVRRGGLSTGPRAAWRVDRARWARGESFRLHLRGAQALLLEVKLGARIGDPGDFRISLLERR